MKKPDANAPARLTRRGFIAASAAAAAAQGCGSFHIFKPHVAGGKAIPPSQKLNIAVIGCGGKGYVDLKGVAGENIVALCDVDENRAARAFQDFPAARRYSDFRRLFDSEKKLDAVVVSTPDHTHAVATAMAIRRGLHVYTQKPLTRTIEEARLLRDLAAKHKVVTQMGNQGTSLSGLRRGVEIVQSGALGGVREVHVWSDRPIWPQGLARPAEAMDPPPTLHWDEWLSAAPARPYNKAYHPFNWRGWIDFGTGALGDMACHTANLPFMALKLADAYPTRVEAVTSERFAESYPKWSRIKFSFPARGEMPPVEFHWYDGGQYPHQDLAPGFKFRGSGVLMIGEKGKLLSGDYNGTPFELLPREKFSDFKDPAPWLPRRPEDVPERIPDLPWHYLEWINACKGNGATLSNFNYAVPLTELTLLGDAAVLAGAPIEWEGEKMKLSGGEKAETMVRRECRKGYSLEM